MVQGTGNNNSGLAWLKYPISNERKFIKFKYWERPLTLCDHLTDIITFPAGGIGKVGYGDKLVLTGKSNVDT